MSEITQEDLNQLTEKLLRERAVDFREYKPTTLGRRVQRRLDATKSHDIKGYLKYLERRPEEYSKLIDSILINVTEFFRDPDGWEILKTQVIPQIIASKRPGDQIRFWSAGCASGEEPYSFAIVLAEVLGPRLLDFDIRIYATDIDDDALAKARRAEYPDEALANVPEELRLKYFTKNGRWMVTREIRRMVIFGRHNLATDAPISHVDLLACRNVMIYMTVDLQNRILSKFHYGLYPGGYLFLGRAESLLTHSRAFTPVNERWRVFLKESFVGPNALGAVDQLAVGQAAAASTVEYQQISAFNESVLRYTPTGVIAVDSEGVVRVVNPSAESIWGVRAGELLGKSVLDLDLQSALQGIMTRYATVRNQRSGFRIEEIDLTVEHDKSFWVSASLSPVFDVMGNPLGVTLVAEDITTQVRLRNDLEAANEQLQAANEELETTNEELQSTNEELETTNEELQSTNEELETTNEELQSTNEEITATNDELAVRTADLNEVSLYFGSVLDSLDIPVVVLDDQNIVTTWNPAAERFYGIKQSEALKKSFFDLPLPVRVSKTREKLRSLSQTRATYRSQPLDYATSAGETRAVLVEYQPLVDSLGIYRGAISIVRDAASQALEPAAPEK